MIRIHILAEGKYGGSLSCLVIEFEIKSPDYIVRFLFKGVQWTLLFQKKKCGFFILHVVIQLTLFYLFGIHKV